MIWWYEFRPTTLASQNFQGTWRIMEGIIPDERPGESYLHVDNNETWLLYAGRDGWNIQRSRIKLRPAENFFVVERAFGFDYGNTREAEYIVCLKNDDLYTVRGLARFDPVREYTIEKLRRVDSLPTDATDSIQQYLDRIRARPKKSDEPGHVGRN
jgi:hypothetical protein